MPGRFVIFEGLNYARDWEFTWWQSCWETDCDNCLMRLSCWDFRYPIIALKIRGGSSRKRIGFSWDDTESKRYIWLVQWAWTPVNKGLHPPKTGIWLNSKSEQPIDVKLGLKIRANSSVWLDFRGEKSPSQSPPLTFPCCWLAGVNFTEKIPSAFALLSIKQGFHFLPCLVSYHDSSPNFFKLEIVFHYF